MKEDARKLLGKADRSVAAAQRLLQGGDEDFAVARAYYAMFYAAEALLTERGLRFRKHGGVHAAFGEYFAKPGLLDAELHRWLLNAFDKRLESDYATESTLTREDAVQTIDQAREFVKRVANFLKSAR